MRHGSRNGETPGAARFKASPSDARARAWRTAAAHERAVLRAGTVRRAALVLGVLVCLATAAHAQERPANPYRPNAADEDWTFLKATPKSDLWDRIKYIPLGPDDWSLTLSGEFRLRPEGLRIRETAARPGTVDNYLLQRYLFGADARLGRRVRVFTEVQSGIINGSLRSPRPTDRNSLDLHQAFVEIRQPVGRASRATLALGRQELEIGSSRLISASPGLNVKRSFDGVSFLFRASAWRVVAAGATLVGQQMGAFDDRSDLDQVFWGVGAGGRGPVFASSDVGAYYLGIDRDVSQFAQGRGPERRHTLGANWSGGGRGADFNYDAILQWGRFDAAPIRAWAFATETGFRLSAPWRPRISVRMDMASGDADPENRDLQSFNPLFPGNAYSGAIGLLGPTNLTDFTPAILFSPRRTLVLGFEAPSYWRTSTRDGVYATDLRVLFGPGAGTGKYVGTNPGLLVVWQATRHLQLQGVITRFLSGRFLDDTFVAEDFGFYSFTTRYRF